MDLCLVMEKMWHFLELNCICPGEKLVDVILQDETVSRVGYCPVLNAIISKQSDLRLDVTGDVINVQEEEERSKDHSLQNTRYYRKPGGLRTIDYHALSRWVDGQT